jgi:hypothetical protein
MLRRFGARDVGPATIGVLAGAEAVVWAVARPSGEPAGAYIGQLLGAESILLLSIGLVLISTLPWVEEWFDGIDRAAIWHRRVAIAGLVLLAPHILLASSPHGTALGGPLGALGAIGLVALAAWAILPRWRAMAPAALQGLVVALADAPGVRHVRLVFGGYERWRALHRTTGLFVAAGFVHGLLDGSPFGASQALRWSYVASGGVGLAFYVYRELFAHFFLSLHDYQVAEVGAPERFPPTEVPRSTGLGLDLRTGEIRAVVWATGFEPDYRWLDVPVVDAKGRLSHDGGVVDSPGLYALGLPVLRRRKSTFIHGIEDDAREVIEHLNGYLARDSRSHTTAGID